MDIEEKDLLDLIHWARRYCDKRTSGVAHSFNQVYNKIYKKHYKFLLEKDKFDHTLTENGEFFPYAQDGMYKLPGYDAVNIKDKK